MTGQLPGKDNFFPCQVQNSAGSFKERVKRGGPQKPDCRHSNGGSSANRDAADDITALGSSAASKIAAPDCKIPSEFVHLCAHALPATPRNYPAGPMSKVTLFREKDISTKGQLYILMLQLAQSACIRFAHVIQ